MKSSLQPNALKVQVFISRKRHRIKSSRKSISMQSSAVGLASTYQACLICTGKPGLPTERNRRHTGYLPIDKKGKPLNTPRQLIRDNGRFPEAILKTLSLEDSPTIPVSDLNEDGPCRQEEEYLLHEKVHHDWSWTLHSRIDC